MVEEVKKTLQDVLDKVPGLHAIIITDRDGVAILQALSDKAPACVIKPNFISTFGIAVDQGSKLGLGKTRTLISIYSQFQVVQMNKLPLLITFIATDSCNTGHILALEKQLDPIVANFTMAVVEA